MGAWDRFKRWFVRNSGRSGTDDSPGSGTWISAGGLTIGLGTGGGDRDMDGIPDSLDSHDNREDVGSSSWGEGDSGSDAGDSDSGDSDSGDSGSDD